MGYFDLKPEKQKIIDDISRVGIYFWDRGWAGGNAGNISVNLEDFTEMKDCITCSSRELKSEYPYLANKVFLVTASGRRMRDIGNFPEENLCIVKMNSSGKSYEVLWGCRTGRFPTSEFEAHLGAYNIREEMGKPVSVIMHTQPLDMIALSLIHEYQSTEKFSELLWRMQPETIINIPEGIAFLEYDLPGSSGLAVKTIKAFKDGYRLAVWANHGVIAIGNEIDEVLDLIDHGNSSSAIALKLLQAGYNPRNLGLKNKDLTDLARVAGLKSSPFYKA